MNQIIRSSVVGIIGLVLCVVAACEVGDAAPPDGAQSSPTTEVAFGSTGSCRPEFGTCVANSGGAACAQKWCVGACVPSVASCVSGGGGKACANRCSCTPDEVWTEIWTWECGFPYGWGGENAAAPGKAHATCTHQCNGTTSCSVWHYGNGRAQCTLGVPLDLNQNPW